MAIQYIPRQQNPWTAQLPGFLQNLVFQQMAAKRQDAQVAQQQELAQTRLDSKREYDQQQGMIKRESELVEEGHVPVNAESAASNPQGVFYDPMTRKIYRRPLTVEKESMVWVHNPKSKVKRKVTQAQATSLVSKGWTQGQPYGPQGQGLKITQGPDGVTTVSMGGEAQPGPLTTAAKTASQKNIKTLRERKARLEDSMSKWRPHYNTFLTKGSMWLRGLQEKAQGLPGVPEITPEAKQELAQYTDFKASSLEDFSKTIHEFSGSALTPLEAKIHRAWIQDAKKDSSTEWITKLKQNWMSVNKSLAREHYYLNVENMPRAEYEKLRKSNKITEADFDRIVDQKYAEYLLKLRRENPNAEWEQLKAEAKGFIKASFFGF